MAPRRSIVALLALLVFAGCGGSNADRAGGASDKKPLVLTFVGYEPLVSYADAVRRLSHGTLQIRVVPPAAGSPAAVEAKVIADVRAGRVDGAWVGSRAFDGVGVTSFDALIAPLLIDSYELEEAVLTSPLASAMLADLRPLGLT